MFAISSDANDSNGRRRADMDTDFCADSDSSDCDSDKPDPEIRQAGLHFVVNGKSNSL